ncbi:hypothetical protein ACLOJK_027439, partial [Asimina triloba]
MLRTAMAFEISDHQGQNPIITRNSTIVKPIDRQAAMVARSASSDQHLHRRFQPANPKVHNNIPLLTVAFIWRPTNQ